MHPTGRSDEQGAVAFDIAGHAGSHLNVVGHDGVEKMDVAAFVDHDAPTMNVPYMMAAGADEKFASAVDVAGNVTLNHEIPAVNFFSAEVPVFSDQDVPPCADRGRGVQVNLEIFKTDIDSAHWTVGGLRRTVDL